MSSPWQYFHTLNQPWVRNVMRRRELLVTAKDTTGEFVDLGLSVKWASGNIVKNGTKYSIGASTDRGCYFSWGNVEGHNYGEGYDFSQSTYESTPGHSLNADISAEGGYDAARVTIGGNWRMPTKAEFKELYDNTDSEWIDDYNGSGVAGCKFKKKSDTSVYIFLPACGICNDTYPPLENRYGYYRSSTYNDSDYAYILYFESMYTRPENLISRYYGLPVRGVMSYIMDTNVLFYNTTSNQYKVFNFSDFPSNDLGWTPIAIEVVPPSHDRYGDGSGGYMSLGCIDSGGTIQTNGAIDSSFIYWCARRSNVVSLADYTTMDESNNYDGYVHYQTNSEGTSCSFYNTPQVQYPYASLNVAEVKSYSVGCLSDYDGVGNTNILNSSEYPAAYACKQVSTLGTSREDWYLPSAGELAYLPSIRFEVNKTISSLQSAYGNVGSLLMTTLYYWSSTEVADSSAWCVILGGGRVYRYRKDYTCRVRPFLRFNPTAGTIVR